MGLAMNRFLLMPKPKPEFKMAQPLPAFFEISAAKRDPAGAPEALTPGLRQNNLTMLPAAAKMESFNAFRNVTS
jgi:hypothetical protein